MNLNDKQKKILELLKTNGEIATTKVASLISSNLYQTEVYLEELFEENLISYEKKNNATYWRIKNGN